MFNVIIVEDEKPILDLMKYVIGQNPHYTILGTFTHPLEALASLSHLNPDVAFLDVEMPKMNGLELAQKINEMSDYTKIIFTTAHKDYALEAFHVQAFDYILKPVTKTAIERITNRLIKQHVPAFLPEQRVKQTSIRCFGGLEVRNSQGVSVHWPTRKTEELFAYLLCHPGMEFNKWHLADLLWPDMDEDRAIHNLHNTMYRLKKLLKEHEMGVEIQKVNEGYALDIGNLVYDVLEFERNHQSFSERVRDSVKKEHLFSIYKGSLLERKDYLWKASLEERFIKQYTILARSLIQQAMDAEDWDKAEQRVEQYLALYPLNEEMNLFLLQIYENRGRRDQMMKHYVRFKDAYRLEIGVEPSYEIKNWAESRLS